MNKDLINYIEDIYRLCKYDKNYNEATLLDIKSNITEKTTLQQLFKQQIFKPFPTIQYIISALHFYNYSLTIFQKSSNPIFTSLSSLKANLSYVETKINKLQETKDIFQHLGKDEVIKEIEKTIEIFEEFLKDPDGYIEKLLFFKFLQPMPNDKINFKLANLNPFNMHIRYAEEISSYVKYLEIFEGYNISKKSLETSINIKIHKLLSLDNPNIFKKDKELIEILKSLFFGADIKYKIDLSKLDNVYPKTFFHSVAIFDYSNNSNQYILNKYYDDALQEHIMSKVSTAKQNGTHIEQSIIDKLQDLPKKYIIETLKI